MSSGHVKFNFYILNSFTKRGNCQNMLCFKKNDVTAVKL